MRISFKDILDKDSQVKKDELLKSLRVDRLILNKFLISQYRQRRLVIEGNPEITDSTTEIAPDKYVKKINYKIILGLDDKESGIIQRKIFAANLFTPDQILEFNLLRQICVCMFNELTLKENKQLQSLITLSKNQYALDKKFYTFYGSYDNSMKHTSTPEVADITELITMLIWDAQYFTKYFRFLISTLAADLDLKKAFSIKTLSTTDAKIIEEFIYSIAQNITTPTK